MMFVDSLMDRLIILLLGFVIGISFFSFSQQFDNVDFAN